jgi:hypothetical protein
VWREDRNIGHNVTVSDLIAKLSSYPANARVTLLDPDKRWLLPIEITHLSADGSNCGVDFIALTADSTSDEIEGIANSRLDCVLMAPDGVGKSTL